MSEKQIEFFSKGIIDLSKKELCFFFGKKQIMKEAFHVLYWGEEKSQFIWI